MKGLKSGTRWQTLNIELTRVELEVFSRASWCSVGLCPYTYAFQGLQAQENNRTSRTSRF